MAFFQEIIYLKKLKDGAYIINLAEHAKVGTNQIALLCKRNGIAYFNSFGVEYIPEEIKEFTKKITGNKNIKTNIIRAQEDNSVMCGYLLHRIY